MKVIQFALFLKHHAIEGSEVHGSKLCITDLGLTLLIHKYLPIM
jgi:hypothetical protein